MIIKNCKIIFKDKIENGSVLIKNGKIEKINLVDSHEKASKAHFENIENEEILDAGGLYLSPGFIDAHIHGAGGYDTMDGTIESLNNISKVIMKHGTTSFVPTTMSVDVKDIRKSLKAIKYIKENGRYGAHVLGAHLEGPFLNKEYLGAQNPKYILNPSIEKYKNIVENFEDAVISITLAPEIKGALDLIEYISKRGIVCSAGHTKASYEEIIQAIKHGVSHSTHLYNRMSGFNHREVGTVGAVFDTDITTETIADNIHVSYPALRLAYKVKSTDKVLLVSDAMMGCCMKDGMYSLGGQDVYLKSGEARLKDGTLAGSVLTLDKAVRNVYKNCNIPLYEAVKMASLNPAKHCKVDSHKGLIKEGYDADLVLFDEDLSVKQVLLGGKCMLHFY